jgi:hypothetical protein
MEHAKPKKKRKKRTLLNRYAMKIEAELYSETLATLFLPSAVWSHFEENLNFRVGLLCDFWNKLHKTEASCGGLSVLPA